MSGNIYLNQSIPLLFGTPTAKASNWAIAISLFVMVGAIFSYALVNVVERFPFFGFISVLLIIHCIAALTSTGVNLLYIFRYMLVWLLIFVAAAVFALYQGEVLLNWFGVQYQSVKNTQTLVMAGVFSLCGSLIGWHSSMKKLHKLKHVSFTMCTWKKKRFQQVGFLMSFGFAALYLWNSGGISGSSRAYGDNDGGLELTFGVFNIFHFIGIALLILSAIKKIEINRKIILLGVLSLIPGILTGSRADYLPQIFILLILLANSRIIETLKNKDYSRVFYYALIGVLLVVIGYFVATFMAIWRVGSLEVIDVFNLMLAEKGVSLIREINGKEIIFLETGNMILGGLYSAIVQVREEHTGLLFGESYFNYFLNAPPAFLGLPRPEGLEWLTEINGVIMTQGGIFEVAEAYWNFGLIGCFVVSFGLSYFFGYLLRRGVTRSNYFFLVWFFVFGFHGFRSIWYQNFSYFRLLTIMLIVYIFCMIFAKWTVSDGK